MVNYRIFQKMKYGPKYKIIDIFIIDFIKFKLIKVVN